MSRKGQEDVYADAHKGGDKDEPTYPCKVCGRRFIRSSLEKHEPVCKKLSKLNRKPFDSGKQRASGSDITYNDIKRAQKEKEKLGGTFPRPKTQWKERHETFIDAVSASKKVDYAIKTGAPLPPPPKSSVPSDYVQCQYCGRSFNERAAERHIPFCKEQQTKKAPMRTSVTRGAPLTSQTNRAPTRGMTSQKSRESSMTRQGRESDRGVTSDKRRTESRRSESRSKARSATHHTEPPPTSNSKRSKSAPRTSSSSRLKTPATDKAPPKTPKTPKTPKSRHTSRGRTGSKENRIASRF